MLCNTHWHTASQLRKTWAGRRSDVAEVYAMLPRVTRRDVAEGYAMLPRVTRRDVAEGYAMWPRVTRRDVAEGNAMLPRVTRSDVAEGYEALLSLRGARRTVGRGKGARSASKRGEHPQLSTG
eukprot:364995-Chlamydomonas_euryale.AAC.5